MESGAGLRGFGDVLWYLVASPQRFLSEGNTLFTAIGRAKLRDQDWLTTVVEQEADSSRAHVTGAMIDFIEPFDISATMALLRGPQIRIHPNPARVGVFENGDCRLGKLVNEV